MITLWCIIGLILATISVATLGAAFSVLGLSALFSGAALAVIAMAASLEFAKFVLAAYVHQRWHNMNIIFKSYLLFSIVVLSLITSMGIFGFLSAAYQSASIVLEAETIKIEALQTQKKNYLAEIVRINHSIEEIPARQASKRVKFRSEVEPIIADLTQKSTLADNQISESNLNLLEVKKKVGPLIYIAKMFNMDIDVVVKYLILTLVSVFDPLAICLVIATSDSLASRRRNQFQNPAAGNPNVSAAPPPDPAQGEVIQMRFADQKDTNVV